MVDLITAAEMTYNKTKRKDNKRGRSAKFKDPRYITQHEQDFEDLVEGKDNEVIKDLLWSLQNIHHAIAIAAPQRGWDSNIFVSRFDLFDANRYHMFGCGVALQNVPMPSPAIYKVFSWEPVRDEGKVEVKESCLSYEHSKRVVELKRFKAIKAHFKHMSEERFRRDRNRFKGVETSTYLANLGAQIFQHEIQHLEGSGIWNFEL